MLVLLYKGIVTRLLPLEFEDFFKAFSSGLITFSQMELDKMIL